MSFPSASADPFDFVCPGNSGNKSVKYITRITVTDNPKLLGEGLGSASSEDWHGSDNRGYAWYAGI